MQGTLNVHRLLRGTATRPGYLNALNISDKQDLALRAARDEVRRTLRLGLPEWDDLVIAKGLIELPHILSAKQLPPLRPKFRMQGSFVYSTVNNPAHMPPQEVDLDDGVFLPTSYISGDGKLRPMLSARGYFRIVESILNPLCERKGWSLDSTKSTCVRICLDGGAHIDLPLYAIPDVEFALLAEASARAQLAKGARRNAEDEIIFSEEIYKSLREDQIMLAYRDGRWVESDPRKIERWFLDAVSEHGEVLRRASRYLKGWRDHQWLTGGPSSLSLMACAVVALDEIDGELPDNRDDITMLAISERLPSMFSGQIPNPVLPEQFLDQGWTEADRQLHRARAADLQSAFNTVLNSTYNKSIAIARLMGVLGERLPGDELLIGIETAEQQVQAYEPAKVVPPVVPRTTSG